jgi:glycine cleavage system H protein
MEKTTRRSTMRCPHLEEVVVRYCKAFPIKKMIPQHHSDAQCACISDEYTRCSEYCASTKCEEVEMGTEVKSESVGGNPSYFPPGYYHTCCVYACSVCPYRGVCVAASATERETSVVRGFFLMRDLQYHDKHYWMKARKDGTVRVGLDDFARKLLGDVTRIRFPEEQATVQRGDTLLEIELGDKKVVLLSPVAGEIARVNPKVDQKPSLVSEDPYRNWLVSVKPSASREDVSTLMGVDQAETWLEKEVDRLHYRVESELGVTVADGGELMIAESIDADDWSRLVEEFLYTR